MDLIAAWIEEGCRWAGRRAESGCRRTPCIGKPTLRWLPPSSNKAAAATKLEGAGAGASAAWDGEEGSNPASSAAAHRANLLAVAVFRVALLAPSSLSSRVRAQPSWSRTTRRGRTWHPQPPRSGPTCSLPPSPHKGSFDSSGLPDRPNKFGTTKH